MKELAELFEDRASEFLFALITEISSGVLEEVLDNEKWKKSYEENFSSLISMLEKQSPNLYEV